MAFSHLHVHTEYSMLDGALKIKELVAEAKKQGMKSVAITDHGNMSGVYDFYKEAKEAGIRPVIGCEVYTAARGMQDRDPIKDKNMGHLVLLVKNEEGYRNLIKLVSLAYTEGYYYKPRVDKELLRHCSGGLIALSACLAGDIPAKLLVGDYAGAKKEALEFLEIFGEGNFYLELQDHKLPEQARILPDLIRLHEETGIPLVATNDVHYLKREHAESHDVLLCIQTGKTVDDQDRMRFTGQEFYFKTEKEMRALFADYPEALDNSVKIAEMCELEFNKESFLPEYTVPEGYTAEGFLRELTERGLDERYGASKEDYRERAEYELSVIIEMGFVNYFLVVWDFINFAKSHDIPVGPGRGSGAGSIVAYALRITDLDPIKYGLLFERFLNPERVSNPDFDIDFCYRRRGEVIDYVIDKYGRDNVAQIATFNTMKAKAAIKDVGRALGIPYGEVDKISKAVPMDGAAPMDLKKALAASADLRAAKESDDRIDKLFKVAIDLEGLSRSIGTHAAGVVIAKRRIDECVPVYASEGDDKLSSRTQFNMVEVEEIGLLKMDFLGLRTLTVIKDAIDMVKENHGIDIDFSRCEYDDPGVYEMIAGGNTAGVFQLESAGMTSFFTKLRPTNLEEITAGIALYRPGPMDHIPEYLSNRKHPESIKYLTPLLEKSLGVTYGVMIYQEQAMEIVRELAGFSMGGSDEVRRAMSKKKIEKMEGYRKLFIEGGEVVNDKGEVHKVPGAAAAGVPPKVASEIFDNLISFASYAFNKSHAAVYAVLSYQTAYLKCHYRAEFMAALMSSFIGDSAAQIARYIGDCEKSGIETLPPDILESDEYFSVTDGKIRIGLRAIKNVGSAASAVIEARSLGLPIESMLDFLKIADLDRINKKAIESMIKSGAFDRFEKNRARHLAVFEIMIDRIKSDRKSALDGQFSLMDLSPGVMESADINVPLPDMGEVPKRLLLEWEKEILMLYISGHPLDSYKSVIERIAEDEPRYISADMLENLKDYPKIRDRSQVCAVGLLTDVRTFLDKKGSAYARVIIEDFRGSIEAVVFSGVYERTRDILNIGQAIILRGSLDIPEDRDPSIRAEKISDISVAESYYANIRPAAPEALSA